MGISFTLPFLHEHIKSLYVFQVYFRKDFPIELVVKKFKHVQRPAIANRVTNMPCVFQRCDKCFKVAIYVSFGCSVKKGTFNLIQCPIDTAYLKPTEYIVYLHI